MGNSQSMNNLSLIEHRRQNTEFLRYSQIPYERPPPQQQLNHVNLREINNINGFSNLPKPIKVLPDVNNLPKLRSTNNGAILQTCGTITARKDTECGLHRSKSISETNPDDLFAIPSHFKMQRASTQLSITHTSKMKENKIAESKIGNNQVVKQPQQPVAIAAAKKSQFTAVERNSSRFIEKKMFGDTLKKQQEMELRQLRPQLRREKTFDMTLIHTTSPHNEREKFTPKFSPQVQQKRMTTKTNVADEQNIKSTHNSAIKNDRPSVEKMKTIDRKFIEKKKGLAGVLSNGFVSKNANEVSNNKKYTKEMISKRASPITKPQSIPKVALSSSKKVEPLKENKSNDSVKITQMIEKNQSQTDVVVRKFAEEVTKMSSAADLRQIQVQNESDHDSDSTNILISLRPTLPRRQLQIPHFSPTIAWKSLSTDINDEHNMLTDAQHLMMNDDMGIEKKIEKVYIEPSFNLPFTDNKSGDSGISADKEIGNSAEMLQSSMPSAYMIPSWTPQQDLEDDDSSDQQEQESENFPQSSHHSSNLGENNQASFKGSMFSFSLPRDQCIEKIDCNNFYSLQKFKKADIFDSMTNLNESQFPNNSGTSATDNNWLLGSQHNASAKIKINENCEKQRSQIISQMKNGRHVMYLPNSNSRMPPNEVKVSRNSSIEKEYYEPEHIEGVNLRSPSSKNHKFKFQSTIRVTERKKMAEKLSREAEEKEMQRLCELEAMKKVEEEFQKKRLREKNRLRQQLRINSLDNQQQQHHFDHNPRFSERRSNDTQTPYISRLVESKSARRH
ncbi:hypothetical protein PVAND_003713 [Polypedilum vanderplanki]|uniref:Uncharacterized protein n=1 Tax=Polypedilum vanderplanki TaxID=319348 RepID=A0A9J6BUW3_POLVA|nr:hypothetical protein PVAND_003713 [Polypedilum vanderplanki]